MRRQHVALVRLARDDIASAVHRSGGSRHSKIYGSATCAWMGGWYRGAWGCNKDVAVIRQVVECLSGREGSIINETIGRSVLAEGPAKILQTTKEVAHGARPISLQTNHGEQPAFDYKPTNHAYDG